MAGTHKRNTSGLIPLKPGQSGNLNGRPRKMVTQLKDIGYRASEVTDTLMTLLALNIDELKKVYENPDATMLEKIVANALKTSLQRGSLFNLELVLSRAIGRPKEATEEKKPLTTEAFKVEVVQVAAPLANSEDAVQLEL
jgi:hypothetical protein